MSFSGKTSFLSQEVLPKLDAGAAGLLDEFNAKQRQRVWVLDCPACKKPGAAYHYPGHATVICSRKNNCGVTTSIWDIVAARGGTPQDVFLALCSAANVVPPARSDGNTDEIRCSAAARGILKTALLSNEAAANYLERTRKFPRESWERLEVGYYPTARWMAMMLEQKGASLEIARRWNILPSEPGRESAMAGRIVGWWRQADGSLRLWGRLIGDAGPDTPKYLYSAGMSKTVPYNFRRPGHNTVVCVEGPFDQLALEVCGVPSCAAGGDRITKDQATFLAEQGVESLLYIMDDDKAGAKGALATIENCEPLGISTFFARPKGGKDVDEMRRDGMTDDIHMMINDAPSSGAHLAQQILAIDDSTKKGYDAVKEYQRLRGLLTPSSWSIFERILVGAGRRVVSAPAEALRVAAALAAEGVPLHVVTEVVERRFGLSLTINGVK